MNIIGFNYEATRFEPFVILAVTSFKQDAKEQGQRNALFHLYLLTEGIAYKALQGSYKGQTEQSYLIRLKDYPKVVADRWVEGQESVLFLSAQEGHREGRRHATLRFLDGGHTPDLDLGWWTAVSRETALERDSWTYDPHLGEYFIAKRDTGKKARLNEIETRAHLTPHFNGI